MVWFHPQIEPGKPLPSPALLVRKILVKNKKRKISEGKKRSGNKLINNIDQSLDLLISD